MRLICIKKILIVAVLLNVVAVVAAGPASHPVIGPGPSVEEKSWTIQDFASVMASAIAAFLAYLAKRGVQQVHVIVNSQKTEMLAKIERLEKLVASGVMPTVAQADSAKAGLAVTAEKKTG